jgi:stalled ribosome alternative rescue factor ArfA
MVGKHIFRSRVEKDKRAKAREIAVEKGLGS